MSLPYQAEIDRIKAQVEVNPMDPELRKELRHLLRLQREYRINNEVPK